MYKKKLIILFFYLSPMINSLLHHCWPSKEKNPGTATYLGMDRENYYSGRSWYECIVLKDDMLSTLLEIGIPPSPTTKEKDVTLRHVNFTFSHLFWFFFLFIKPSFFFLIIYLFIMKCPSIHNFLIKV